MSGQTPDMKCPYCTGGLWIRKLGDIITERHHRLCPWFRRAGDAE